MAAMFEFMRTVALVGGVLCVTMVVMLSLPQSKLRDFLLPIAGWCFALFCGVYVLSPVDVSPEAIAGPFGLIDDAGVLVAGVASARAAMRASKTRKEAA